MLPARAFELGDPYVETIADADALPDNIVSALAQDAEGFLWVGTNEALLRFDGYRFERILGERGRIPSPAGLFAMALWSLGTAVSTWAPTPMDFGDSIRVRAKVWPDQPSIGMNVFSMLEGRDGHIWISAAGNAGFVLDPVSLQLQRTEDVDHPIQGTGGCPWCNRAMTRSGWVAVEASTCSTPRPDD